MNRRNLYAVPDLPVKDIITYFSEVGIEVTTADILKPTQAAVIRIFESILELFIGSRTIEEESLQIISIVQRMGEFLVKIGIQNFTIRDLQPDSKRFTHILSTIINFGMYRDNKRHVYEKVSTIADENYATKKRLENELNRVKNEINDVNIKLAENDNIKMRMEDEIKSLETELKEFYKHQKDKISEVGLLKAEKTELSDKLSSTQLLEHNLKQEISILKTQIVSDPTKLLELVDEMRQLIEKERESIRAIETSISEREATYNDILKYTETFKRARDISREIAEYEKNIDQVDHRNILLEGKLKNWDSSINSVKIRINHIDRQISHLESKIFNLQNKDKKCSEEISAKISNLRIKYDLVSGEREQMMAKVNENNKLVQEIMYEKAMVKGEYEKESSDIISLLIDLNSKIDSYFSDLNSCFS